MTNALVKIDAARRALAEARSILDVKEVRDQAQAIAHYLKVTSSSFQAQQLAIELKLRAERKLGELLAETELNKGGNPNLSHGATGSPLTLEESGITRSQSSRWQTIARIPDPVFEGHIAEAKATKKELTTASVLRLTVKPPEDKPFNAPEEAERTYKWLQARRAEWPEGWRLKFIGVLRNLLDQMEAEDVARGGETSDSLSGQQGETLPQN